MITENEKTVQSNLNRIKLYEKTIERLKNENKRLLKKHIPKNKKK